MSGYKRVNFYELCRLCATNREKNKTHIFEEDGRKMQLREKIQACLAVKVSENDCLPKVVCSDCLRNLEQSFAFRERCVTSERMLSTYFDNYRHTDDFKKSGQVYIKDDSYLTNIKGVKFEKTTESNINVSVNQNGEVIKISQCEITGKPEDYGKISVVVAPNQSYNVPISNNEGFECLNVPIKQGCNFNAPIKMNGPIGDIGAKNGGIKSDLTENGNSGGSRTYSCELCTKIFKRREHLYQHIKLHSGFRPFVCEHCKKSFMRKEHLQRHMTCHNGQKNFVCHLCMKSFSRNDNLLKHKKIHEKKNGYKCKMCGKQFAIKHYYASHKCDGST